MLAALRRRIVQSVTLRPALGQALLWEHSFYNPHGQDAVFEVAISHPHELVPITKARGIALSEFIRLLT